MKRVRALALVAIAVGCATSKETDPLGITRFEVTETTESTTVIARDAAGGVVGRMDLIHGPFVLSEENAVGRADSRVVGRKLSVEVLGQSLKWETPGFHPILHMPAHPPDQWAIAAFLADAHVAPILKQWQIGFQLQAGVSDPFAFRVNGTNVLKCSGAGQTRCATVFRDPLLDPLKRPNTCGGGFPADVAFRVHQRAPDASYSGYDYWDPLFPDIYDQSFIIQCCARSAMNPNPFLGEKSCPDFDGMWATPTMEFPTTCGWTTPGACMACASYPTSRRCAIEQTEDGNLPASGDSDPLAPDVDKQVYDLKVRYAWTCGDEVCDHHVPLDTGNAGVGIEDADNCPRDCAPVKVWIGLKNSDDTGTRFDLRTELLLNGAPIATGLARCIEGVVRNPSLAKEVPVSFPLSPPTLSPGDVLSLRVSTRVGTNPDDSQCPGHLNAVGLRLYYDGITRPSRVLLEVTTDPLAKLHLRGASPSLILDNATPMASVARTLDSPAINFAGGNPWREIGVWSLTR